MADRIAAAHELVDELNGILKAAGLKGAAATLNALEVPSLARHGVVVVGPPSLEFPTWGDAAVSWELHVVAGPPDNYLEAWALIDRIINALEAGHLNLKSGEPGQFETRGNAYPAYTITTNPLD